MCWLLTEISFNLSRSETGNRVKMERLYTDIEINGPFRLQVDFVGLLIMSASLCVHSSASL